MPDMVSLDLGTPPPRQRSPDYQLGVGRVLGRTFAVTFANLPSFLLGALVVHSPGLALQVLAALPIGGAAALVLSIAHVVVGTVLSLLLSGALTFAVIRHLRGQPATVAEAMRAGLGRFTQVLLVSLVVTIVFLIGLVFCVVPGIVVFCMNWVAVPVAVVEGTGYRASLERSQELTSGTRLPIFAVLLVLFALGWGATTVSATILGAIGSIEGWGARLAPLVPAALSVLGLPVECLQSAAAAVGYHDLRVHREGADVEDLVRVFE
jgi:hypothetical protein